MSNNYNSRSKTIIKPKIPRNMKILISVYKLPTYKTALKCLITCIFKAKIYYSLFQENLET